MIKLQAFYSSYFRGKDNFDDDGTQNYLVFQPMYSFFGAVKLVKNSNKDKYKY